MGILIACTLGFTPVDKRVASIRLRVGGLVLTVVCAYAPRGSSEYPPFLGSLGEALESAPAGELTQIKQSAASAVAEAKTRA